MNHIGRNFFNAHPTKVARKLLGSLLCVRTIDGKVLKGIIVETEAYRQDEESCHAWRGVTKRSKTLFAQPGTLYVYFTYGMYHCVNVVTEDEGIGSAVLIRALEPLFDAPPKFAAGPGKLCREFNITKEFNEIDTCKNDAPVWFEHYKNIKDEQVVQTTRIGIKKAQELEWRFYIKNNPCVSKR